MDIKMKKHIYFPPEIIVIKSSASQIIAISNTGGDNNIPVTDDKTDKFD